MKAFLLSALFLTLPLQETRTTPGAVARQSPAVELAQFTPLSFNAWRPYKSPESLVQIGMNRGQVLAIAGRPDHEESYYQGLHGRWWRISDWYYVRTGLNRETALLKFSGDTLVSISVTPIQ